MWGSVTAIDISGIGSDAWSLFQNLGVPIVVAVGGVVLFGVLLFVMIAALKSVFR